MIADLELGTLSPLGDSGRGRAYSTLWAPGEQGAIGTEAVDASPPWSCVRSAAVQRWRS